MGDLKADQHALAQYMSDLSERAYCAGWMQGLEYALWEVVLGERQEYGRAIFSDEHVAELRRRSEASGGWIIFDEDHGETWVSLTEWHARFRDWKANAVEK